MQKTRKGFTLVELVVVIAVIAILAGVLIGTFASVINRANESARLQEVKAQEIEQKAEDLLKKIDDSNWYGWEDFEVSLAQKLTAAYKENAAANKSVTPEALREALDEYFKKYINNQTALTEEQVKAIVENALGSFKYEGVTEAQVRAIVDVAATGITSTQLTAAQVKAIVNAANAKNLTLADVVKAITDANLATTADVTTLAGTLSTIQSNLLTKEQVESIIKTYLPVTVTVTSADDAASKAVELNSGSTIIFSNMDDADVVIDLGTDYKTLYFNGKANSFSVTAPNATIVLNGDYQDVVVESIAYNCLHINGTVKTLTLKQGKAILDDATVEKVVVEAETAKVVVELSKEAKITEVLDVQKSAGTVAVENKGTIQKVTAGEDVKAGEAVVKNVDNGVVTDLPGSDDGNSDEHVVITNETGASYKILVTNQQELEDALVVENNGKVIVIDADFEVASTVDVPVGLNVTINLNGHTITAALKEEGRHYYALDNYGILTIVDTVGTGTIEARGIENVGGVLTIESGNFVAVDKGGSAIWNDSNADGINYLNKADVDAAKEQDQNYYDTDLGISIANGVYTVVDVDDTYVKTSSYDQNAGGSVKVYIYNKIATKYGKLYINGGTFSVTYVGSSKDDFGTSCVNSRLGTELHITDGTFNTVSQRTYAIISFGADTIVDNAIVNGTHGGISSDGGTLTINGGTFTAQNYYGLYVSNDAGKTAGVVVNGGTFKGGSKGSYCSVHIGSDVNSAVDSNIIIKGGIFLNKLRVQNNVTAGNKAIAISGGTFNFDASNLNVPDFVIDGYKFDEETKTVLAE